MRALLYILLLLVLATAAAGAWLARDVDRFLTTPLQIQGEDMEYTIPAGSTLRGIARDLAGRGLLSGPYDRYYLVGLARWNKVAQQAKAGEYRLRAGLLPQRFLDQIVRGEVTEYDLTLVEGWAFDQVRAAVAGHPKLKQTLVDLSNEEVMQRLGHAGEHPEGRFFADTYHFPAYTSDADFLRRAYDTMQRRLAEEWQGRAPNLPYQTPYEALIMASIIEKETGAAPERPVIAGVMVRRLRKGMLLQTDPTVIYGMGKAYDGNIRRADLKRDTPYNTYTRKGLPPTPIAIPGGEAVHAALHPADGNSLYFVARGDGTHQFSATLRQHNRAVRKYQLQGRGN